MRHVHLPGLDLNLLPALEALLRRRNVTHAAADVGLSQPAMSRALARLRDVLADPLLVRARGGLVLTPRAQEIAARLAPALDQIRTVYQASTFDPSIIERTVRIAAVDTQTVLLGPGIAARLAAEAPGVDVRFEPPGPDIAARIETGAVDFTFALTTTPLPPGAASEAIGDDRLALVMRRGHPAAKKKWTVADYGKWRHAGISIFGDRQSDLDARLAAQGVTRRIAFVTPHFTAALAAVSESDMVTTISRAYARRFADTFDLIVRDPPFAQSDLPIALVWSSLRNADPFLTWMRGVLGDVSRDVHA